jgi:hypothetical protein
MGIFPKCFKRQRFTVGATYLICNNKKIKEVVFRRSSDRGFNFFTVGTDKKLFKGHLYPLEINREVPELTFWLPEYLTINLKQSI